MFWDSSALIPWLVHEDASVEVTKLFEADDSPLIWWATPVECVSAIARRRRESALGPEVVEEARRRLSSLIEEVATVQPQLLIRNRAERLLAVHALRAADALQLAAALVASDEIPRGEGFVSLDDRLREAAGLEGFTVWPEKP